MATASSGRDKGHAAIALAPGHARLGQCSEMSPEGAKGYVTVTVRWARGARRVVPEGAEELDLERNSSASCNGAGGCRVAPGEGKAPAELEVEPSGDQISTGARELLPVGA